MYMAKSASETEKLLETSISQGLSSAEAEKRNKMSVLSRYFIVELPCESTLFFVWDSSAGEVQADMNLIIEKLGRQ